MIKTICVVCALASALLPGIAGTAAERSYVRPAETRYCSDYKGGTFTETKDYSISYSTSTCDSYENPYEAPVFKSYYDNDCVVEAGGNALVYYDRLYDELVPDYKHKYVFGFFTYGSYNQGIENMFTSLYNLTGTDKNGTSVSGFKTGMTAYVTGKGRKLALNKATGNYYNTNLVYLKEQLKKEKVAVVFLDTYSIVPFGGMKSEDGLDTFTHYIYSGLHAVLIYGYRDYYYYDAGGKLIQNNTYFYASTGVEMNELALISVNRYCKIDDVYVIDIT